MNFDNLIQPLEFVPAEQFHIASYNEDLDDVNYPEIFSYGEIPIDGQSYKLHIDAASGKATYRLAYPARETALDIAVKNFYYE